MGIDRGRMFPVGWIHSYALNFDEELVVTSLWDRLLLHSNGFGLGISSGVDANDQRKERSHLEDFHRSGRPNLSNHCRLD